MVQRYTTTELIKLSLFELLETKNIEQITVREITANCGVTTRTFYNKYLDKHDVLIQIYMDKVVPYVYASLDEWHECCASLAMDSPNFFRNAVSYTGQNNLNDIITQFQLEKYKMHISPAVDRSSDLYQLILQGILFFIHGNFGILRESYDNKFLIGEKEFSARFRSVREFMELWMPQIVKEHLENMPVCPPSKALFEMYANRK